MINPTLHNTNSMHSKGSAVPALLGPGPGTATRQPTSVQSNLSSCSVLPLALRNVRIKGSLPHAPTGFGPSGGDQWRPHTVATHRSRSQGERVNRPLSGAISMMLVGVVLYCLIKRKIVRCCVKDSPAHLEQGGNGYNANMAFQHQLGSQPSAPTALQFQAPQAPCLADIENSLAHM